MAWTNLLILWTGTLALILSQVAVVFGDDADGHFCQIKESYMARKMHTVTKTRLTTTEYFCLSHIICSREKVVYFSKREPYYAVDFRLVDICCPGWVGEHCDIACPPGSHGHLCENRCQCQNNATCHPSDGVCTCKPGYMGVHCERKCPPGSHGHYCLYSCEDCSLELCHHEQGCVEPTTSTTTTTKSTTPKPALTAEPALAKDPVADAGGLERVEPPPAAAASLDRQLDSAHSKTEERSSLYIALPLCLIVLIIVLILAVIFMMRRRRRAKREEVDTGFISVSYSAEPVVATATAIHTSNTDEEISQQNCANLRLAVEPPINYGAHGSSADADLYVKKLDDEDEVGMLVQQSYRDRMNDLSGRQQASRRSPRRSTVKQLNAVPLLSDESSEHKDMERRKDIDAADLSDDDNN